MAAAKGPRGTKILGVTNTTLRVQLSVPKGTQTARRRAHYVRRAKKWLLSVLKWRPCAGPFAERTSCAHRLRFAHTRVTMI